MNNEIREKKIETLKLFYPTIFSTNVPLQDNLLRTAFQNATLIGDIPYRFEGEKAEKISPFNNFLVLFEDFVNGAQISRWRLNTVFGFAQENRKTKSILGIRYDGNYNKEQNKPDQSDKLLISFLTDSQKILVDLGDKKIGFRFKQGTAGINLEDYDVQIAFDQLVDKSLIEELFEKSGIKVYDFEINEETNTLAFKCQGKEFKDEAIINLPLSMSIDLNTINAGHLHNQKNDRRPVPIEIKHNKYEPRGETVPISVLDIKAEVVIKGKNKRIKIDELIFTLNQLIALHYIRELKLSYSDFCENTGVKRKIHILLNELQLSNVWAFRDAAPLNRIEDLSRELGILNQPFIDELKKQLKTIRLKSETE